MWYTKIYSVILVCLVFVAIVQGSCLEYGHSCWGAHGKRSGGKIYHGDTNLQGGELNFLKEASSNKNIDENAALNKQRIENFDNLNTMPEHSPQPSSDEETHEFNAENAAKLKNLLRKRNSRFRANRNQLSQAEDLSAEKREHKETRHDHHVVAAERWRKIPLFHLKSFVKTPLNAVAAAAAAENDLLQQIERQEAAAAAAAAVAADEEDGEGVFYDFQ